MPDRLARSLARAALLALAVIADPSHVGAQALPFHVRVVAGAQLDEKGQGLLFTRLNACYALTAAHVMHRSDRASLVAGRGVGVHGSGRLLMKDDGEDDLAILHVSGEMARRCGPELSDGASLDGIVSRRSAGVLAFVVDDGGVMNQPVRVEDVGPNFLRIEATRPGDGILEGQSGSLLKIDDQPAGLLLGAKDSVGKVLRYDRALQRVARFFAQPKPLHAAAPDSTYAVALPAARNNLLSAATGAQVVAWNLMPVSPQFDTENLLLDHAPPWLGDLKTLRAGWSEIDIRLGGEVPPALARIELIGSGVVPSSRRVRDFEVLVRSAEQSSWISVQSGTSFMHEATTLVEFAPVRVRYLRLRLHSNWGDDAAIGLRAVRAYAP